MNFFKMIILILGISTSLGACACAGDCSIKITDVSSKLESMNTISSVNSVSLVDQYSEEPVQRYSILFKDGVIGILEQKHCTMYNLSVSILVPEDYPLDKASKTLSEMVKTTTTWNKWFKNKALEKILIIELASKTFTSSPNASQSLDDKLTLSDGGSETTLSISEINFSGSPYEKIISIYLAIGGM